MKILSLSFLIAGAASMPCFSCGGWGPTTKYYCWENGQHCTCRERAELRQNYVAELSDNDEYNDIRRFFNDFCGKTEQLLKSYSEVKRPAFKQALQKYIDGLKKEHATYKASLQNADNLHDLLPGYYLCDDHVKEHQAQLREIMMYYTSLPLEMERTSQRIEKRLLNTLGSIINVAHIKAIIKEEIALESEADSLHGLLDNYYKNYTGNSSDDGNSDSFVLPEVDRTMADPVLSRCTGPNGKVDRNQLVRDRIQIAEEEHNESQWADCLRQANPNVPNLPSRPAISKPETKEFVETSQGTLENQNEREMPETKEDPDTSENVQSEPSVTNSNCGNIPVFENYDDKQFPEFEPSNASISEF
jgi:hypothetical protein